MSTPRNKANQRQSGEPVPERRVTKSYVQDPDLGGIRIQSVFTAKTRDGVILTPAQRAEGAARAAARAAETVGDQPNDTHVFFTNQGMCVGALRAALAMSRPVTFEVVRTHGAESDRDAWSEHRYAFVIKKDGVTELDAARILTVVTTSQLWLH